jgi:hypothetical protein
MILRSVYGTLPQLLILRLQVTLFHCKPFRSKVELVCTVVWKHIVGTCTYVFPFNNDHLFMISWFETFFVN